MNFSQINIEMRHCKNKRNQELIRVAYRTSTSLGLVAIENAEILKIAEILVTVFV